MNKLQFLAELKSNIHMLEDEEQTDILDEYSQHVDMKVAAGMSGYTRLQARRQSIRTFPLAPS